CPRLRDVNVELIDPVGSHDENQVTNEQRGADRQVVRGNFLLLDHVVLPDELRLALVVGVAVDVGTDDLAAIADVVEAGGPGPGAGADPLVGPVAGTADWQLIVNRLPEELAGLFVEAHHNALVALDFRVARVVVVGADKDLAPGNSRPAVG